MKKQFIFLSFLFLFSFKMTAQKIAEAETLVDTYVKKYNIPAVNVAVVINGEMNFIQRGVYSRKTSKKIDKNAIFQIGSLSKMFTGIIVKSLVAEGKMDLNASIVDYLPKAMTEKTINKLRPITLRDVLHHRSGLPRSSKVILKNKKGNDAYLYGYTEEHFYEDLHKLKLKSKPGEEFRYSNLGYGLVGYMAESATGMSYEELLQKYVSVPFGLKNTSTLRPSQNLVQPYRKDNREVETQAWNLGKCVAGGGIYMSIDDISKLLKQQMSVYQNQETSSPLYVTKDKRPDTGIAYGFGLFDFDNGDFGHDGDLDGFASNYWLRPEAKMGFTFLTSSGGNWTHPLHIDINNLLTGRSLTY